jgi:paraquat-inducible protein B
MPTAAIEAVKRRDPVARLGLAICLGMFAVVSLGWWLWWRATNEPRVHLTMFFRGTVHGVEVGSPVKILGVAAGQIESMGVRVPTEKDPDHYAAVKVALDGDLLAAKGLPRDLDHWKRLREEIARGLRGRLRLISPMTGDMYLDLVYEPGEPAILVSQRGERVAEVPTLADPLSEGLVAMTHKFGELERRDFAGIEREVMERLARIHDAVNPEEIKGVNDAVLAKLEEVRVAVANPKLREKLEAVNADIAEARRALDGFDEKSGKGAEAFAKAAEKLRVDLAEATVETEKIGTALDPRSPALLMTYVRIATLRDDAARVRALCEEVSGANGFLDVFVRMAGKGDPDAAE